MPDMTVEELEALGAELRACHAALPPARKAWADAELRHSKKGRGHDCGSGCVAELVAAHNAVLFVKGCIVAAGEAYKGVAFAEASVRRRSFTDGVVE